MFDPPGEIAWGVLAQHHQHHAGLKDPLGYEVKIGTIGQSHRNAISRAHTQPEQCTGEPTGAVKELLIGARPSAVYQREFIWVAPEVIQGPFCDVHPRDSR